MTKGTRLTSSDYHRLANDQGWSWCETDPVPLVYQITVWRCPRGHIRSGQYQQKKISGFHCHTCKIIDRAIEVDEKHGIKYVSGDPQSTVELITWRCSHQHIFARSLAGLLGGQHACTVCAGLYPKEMYDYHKLAESVGYCWLGETLPKNTLDPTLWLCDQGCHWTARYNQIQRGKRCPHPES